MTAPKSQYGLPTFGGSGLSLDIPSGGGDLFSTAGHGPPSSPTAAVAQPKPSIAYNPVDNTLFVNGQTFRADDYAGLANSPTALTNPPVPKPSQGDWRDVPMSSYEGLVNEIKDPTLATVAKRNFQQALYGMQEIGYGAIAAGAGVLGADNVQNWAGRGAAQANAEQERFAPFNYTFGTSQDDNNVKAFVGSIAQAAPWMVESVVSALSGAGLGIGMAGLARMAAGKAVRGAALSEAEKTALKVASRVAAERGGIAGIVASSYGTGVGDVYNESVQGGQPDPTGAMLRGIPYGMTDAIPELGAFAIGLGKAGALSKRMGGMGLPARVGLGAAGGGIGEGVNEAIQEKILVNERESVQPGYSETPEATSRLFQAGMGGAAPGLLTGGLAAGLAPRFKHQNLTNPNIQTNLLTGSTVNPAATTPLPNVAPPQQGQLDLQGGVAGAPSGDFTQRPAFFNPQLSGTANPYVNARTTGMIGDNFQLTPSQSNPLLDVQRRQGANPDQRQGAPAQDTQTRQLFQPTQQMELLPNPSQVIAPGRAMLMQDRRGDPRQQTAPMEVPPGQMALKLPKVAQGKAAALKKGNVPQSIVSARDPHTAATTNWPTTVTEPVQQPAAPAPIPGKAKLTKKQSSEVGPLGQPAAAVSAIPVPKSLKKSPEIAPQKVELSPPVKASVANDAAVEDNFSGSKFAQQTYQEALKAGQEMQYFNSIQQAIKQKPELEDAIRSYVDSLSPGATKEFDVFKEGDKADDKLISRGRYTTKVPAVKGRVTGRTVTTEKVHEENVEKHPESTLVDLVRNKFNMETKERFITKVKDIYAKTTNKSFVVGGHKLSDYFTNGEPNIIRTNNRNVLVPYEPTEQNRAEFAQREKALREELNAVAQEAAEEDAEEGRRIANDIVSDQVSDEMSNFEAADKWNTSSYMNADTGERAVTSKEVGRLRMKAASILSKFKVSPKLIVVPDFNSLPDFIKDHYKKEGGQDDLSGINFRDQVYIVANKIYNDNHLRAVLLHETLGHFGLRAVVDLPVLQRTLNDIYNDDAVIRAEADALRDSGRYRGRENWQLVEEALAERAPYVPNNIIQRIWNILRRALRALGYPVDTYSDPGVIARGILSASYKYVRYGEVDDLHGHRPSTWVNDILASVNAPAVTKVSSEEVVIKNILMGGWNQRAPFVEGIKRGFSATSLKPNLANGFRDLLNNVKSVNEIARRNGGFRKFFEVVQHETRRIHEFLNTYNEDTKLLHSSAFTPAEQSTLGKLLVQTTLAKLQILNDAATRDLELLVRKNDGSVTVNTDALDKLKAMGRFSPADFAKGIEIQHTTERALTKADLENAANDMKAEVKRIEDTANARIAVATDPEVKRKIVKETKKDVERVISKHETKVAAGVVVVTHKIREAPIEVDPESNIWKAYNVARDTLDKAQVDMLIAKHTAHRADAKQAFEHAMTRLEDKKKGEPAKVVRTFAKDISTSFSTMMNTNRTIDDNGRVLLDDASLGKANAMLDAVYRALKSDLGIKDLENYFPKEHVAKLTEQINQIRDINKNTKDSRFRANVLDFIAGIRTEFTETLGMEEAEAYAKRSIAGGHVALRRYGDYEVNIVLKDDRGNVVTPSENWDNNLMYMRFPSQGAAETAVLDLNKELANISFDVVDDKGQSVSVSPSAWAQAADTVAPLGHKISLYDFMTVADRLGVHLTAENRETVIKALTKADAKARRALQRGGNPGEDKDMVRVVAEQLESAAHIVANKEHKRQLDSLMQNNSAWFGDREELDRWQAALEAANKTGLETVATKYRKMVDQWHFEYDTAPKDAFYYKALANQLREWRAAQSNLIAQKENRVLANARTFVSSAQLGGYVFNIASAAVQMFTLVTHVPAYLATYNAKRAFGGGFGPRSYSAIVSAARDVGHYSLGNLGKLKSKLDTLNLTDNEKRFMLAETQEGVFQAAQFNALQNSKLGTVRMFGQSNRANAALQKWMQFFSWSEEANRRITGLAAYRLFYERAIQSGETAETAHEVATTEARQAVYITQGDYSLPNRPPWARSGFTSLIFMYKMFPILTVQLLRNLPASGRAMFVGTMLLLGGMKSLPFAEDILDILDGIVQRTGLGSSVTRGNAELALRELLDTFAPGMSPVLMRGLLDAMTGASLSARIGVGDIIPGSGFARAGQGIGTAAEDLQGPAGGVISSIYKMSSQMLKGNFDRALRETPVTAAKNVIEGYIYLNNGAILNKRGYMVADDPTVSETIGRFMGFYPERQARSNEFVASTKISIDYAKELKGDFVSRYVSARIDNDGERAAKIVDEVAEWNKDAKGTELQINNFGGAASRAYNEARRPQSKTFLRSAPQNVRRERDHLLSMFGVDSD